MPTDPGYADMAFPGKPQAFVMTPTRELALQITEDLKDASTVRQARILTVYGGVGYEPQLDAPSRPVSTWSWALPAACSTWSIAGRWT